VSEVKRPEVASSLVVGIAVALLALVLVPAAAQARTGNDPCPGVDQQFLVCTDVTEIPAGATRNLGGPESTDPPENEGQLPAYEEDQCQPAATFRTPTGGAYVLGRSQGESGPTDYPYYDSPWNWGWDYWTEGGAWVAWDSIHRGQWPFPQWQGLANGDTGVVSINVSIHNYYAYEQKTRVFWVCFPSGLNPLGSGTTAPAAAGAAAPEVGGVVRTGTAGADRLQGGGGRDDLVGLAGGDGLSGLAGEDHLQGGPGHDKLAGGSGNDLVHGFAGKDKTAGGKGADDVLAGRGNDTSVGGPGPDQVFDDKGRDHLRGGPGNDRFSAHDGDRDRIDCGPGEDIAWIDRLDVAKGCEHAYRTRREAPKKLPKI
jgi:hypothetical protein